MVEPAYSATRCEAAALRLAQDRLGGHGVCRHCSATTLEHAQCSLAWGSPDSLKAQPPLADVEDPLMAAELAAAAAHAGEFAAAQLLHL